MNRLKSGFARLRSLYDTREMRAGKLAAQELWEEFPDEAEAAYWVSHFCIALREVDTAIDFASRAIELAPDKDYYRHVRSLYLLQSGRDSEALADVEVVLLRERSQGRYFLSSEAVIFAAFAHMRRGNFAEVLEVLADSNDEARTWIDGLVSVEDLRRRARAALKKRR